MTRRTLVLLFSLTVLFSLTAQAQTVDEVIQKHIQARGGLQKLKAIKSVKVTGKFTPAGLGQEIPITVQQKRPGSSRFDATFQGQTLVQAYDGETGWKIDPFQGSSEPEKMAGDELKDAIEQADIDGPLVDYKEKGHTVELLGKEDFEGSPVYKLKVTLKGGDVRYIYIDAASNLELKMTSKRKTPGGETEVDSFSGNYKSVNGIMFPFSVENKSGSQLISQFAIDKIELDVPIDNAVFKMPVKAQEKPKAEEKPKEKPPVND